MLSLQAISTLLRGTALYTFYRWAVDKGYAAKQHMKQFTPNFLTESSTGSTLKRYIPANIAGLLNNHISKEKYVAIRCY